MVTKRYVGYPRVSTTKQGENGLAVKAQREAVRRYLLGHHGEQSSSWKAASAATGGSRLRRWRRRKSTRSLCW